MKKTVQIVTLPLNKEGWNKGDIVEFITNSLKRDVVIAKVDCFDEFSISISPNYKNLQLLVLSDDEIQEGDCWINTNSGHIDNEWELNMHPMYKKIIASYPQLEGTLPISKETVQNWIDASTPEEGSVTIDKEFDDWYELMELKSYPNWKPVVDTKGNLLLEFGNQIDRNYPEEYELTQEDAKEWCESIQPSVDPIEEAVEKYRNQWKTGDKFDDIDTEDKAYNAGENYRNGYKDGWEANPANQTVESQKEVIKGYQDAVEALKDIIYAYKELVSNTWDDNDMVDFFLFVISKKRYSDDFNEITSLLEKYKQIKDK